MPTTAPPQPAAPPPPAGAADPPAGQADPPAGAADPPANTAHPPANTADPPANTADPPAGQADPPAGAAHPRAALPPPAGAADPPTALPPPAGAADPPAALPVPRAGAAPQARSRRQATAPTGPAGRRPGPARPGGTDPAERPRGAAAPPLDTTAPSARELAAAFARLYLEVECGRRRAAQLAPLMDPELHARLESSWVRLHQPLAVIRTVHVMASGTRHVDAVVVVQRGRRVGALALRLTHVGAGWRVTAAERPEDGPLPPAPFSLPPERDPADGTDAGGEQLHERYLASARGRG